MSKGNKLGRREFVKSAAAFGGMMILPNWIIGKEKGPNSKLNVAIIGVGGRGKASVSSFMKASNSRVVAFCDVDFNRAASQFKEYPDIPKFKDYRVMLDKMDKDIDAVAVCTPDHMHYPISSWAIAKGKDVFCEKPLTRTMWEAEELKRLAKKAGVITQMGNQGHTNDGWRLVKEWYDAGILGEIEDVYIWTNRPIWPQGELTPPQGEPVPSTLDYDLWLGVAPYQPYSSKVVPFNWRGERNYGTGACGDMACHFMDVPYSAFDLGFPTEVSATHTPFNDYSWPSATSVDMKFNNKRGKDGKITMHWYDGGRKPKDVKRVPQEYIDNPKNKNCTLIVGTKQTVKTNEYGAGTILFPREAMVEMKKSGKLPEPKIERSKFKGNPQAEFATACIERKQPPANFDYAAPFTQMCLMNMVAITQDQPLRFDAEKMRFEGNDSANAMMKSLYEYRPGFIA